MEGHAFIHNGKGWHVERLWKLADQLETFEADTRAFLDQLETARWGEITGLDLLTHFHRVSHADFDHPIILAPDGHIMDGMHRLCRAFLERRETIPAVQFERLPPCDFEE